MERMCLIDTHGVLCDSLQWVDARDHEIAYELASEVSENDKPANVQNPDDFDLGGHAFLTEDAPEILEASYDTLFYEHPGGGKSPREKAKEGMRRRRRMNQSSCCSIGMLAFPKCREEECLSRSTFAMAMTFETDNAAPL